MIKINNEKISSSIFDNLKTIKDLIYYDGPILSHIKSKNNNIEYLFYWVDVDESFNRWLIVEVSEKNLNDFLNKKISLYDVLSLEKNIYISDINDDIEHINTYSLLLEDIPKEYFPIKPLILD